MGFAAIRQTITYHSNHSEHGQYPRVTDRRGSVVAIDSCGVGALLISFSFDQQHQQHAEPFGAIMAAMDFVSPAQKTQQDLVAPAIRVENVFIDRL